MNLHFHFLRKKHPRFYFHSYNVNYAKGCLKFRFHFEIEPQIKFLPEVTINDVDPIRFKNIRREVIDNIAFHLGLMEIPSYWKATCSPEIVIKAGKLNLFQVSWWQDLIYKGLGEFFFRNKIDFTVPDLVEYKNYKTVCPNVSNYNGKLARNGFLVPIGGGKDSAVSCELLKKANRKVVNWCLNPSEIVTKHIKAIQKTIPIVVTRKIDNKLLELNKQGYLNGHTPFSAYLAFSSVMCAILFGYKNVVLSNERSSNEGNIFFNKVEINHQYSKSFDFEKRFIEYSKKFLATNVCYYSLLRPLYELQIAKLFSLFTHHFPYFSSCNSKLKKSNWCQKCPKCLFVFTILYPFIEEHILFNEIFSKNLFDEEYLKHIAFNLLGIKGIKPFECVGSKEETMVAFYLCIKKAKRSNKPLPIILQIVEEKVISKEQNMYNRMQNILNSWNNQHAIPNEIECAVKSVISDLVI